MIGSTKTLTPAVCPGPDMPRVMAARTTIRYLEKRVRESGLVGAANEGRNRDRGPRTGMRPPVYAAAGSRSAVVGQHVNGRESVIAQLGEVPADAADELAVHRQSGTLARQTVFDGMVVVG